MGRKSKIGFVGALVALDQIIKLLVMNFLTEEIVLIPNFLSLNYLKNYGVGFSLLNGRQPLILLFSAILMGCIFYFLRKEEMKQYQIPLLMIFAGGIGNLIDRLIHGFVVDYVDVIIFNYDFPVFNLADSLLVLGAISIIGMMLLEEKRNK